MELNRSGSSTIDLGSKVYLITNISFSTDIKNKIPKDLLGISAFKK